MKFILKILIITLFCSSIKASEIKTIKLRYTSEQWGFNNGRCHKVNTSLIETKNGDKVFPRQSYPNNIEAMFYIHDIINDTLVIIELSREYLVDGRKYMRYVPWDKYNDTNLVSISIQDIKFSTPSRDGGTNHYLRIDTNASLYKTNDTGNYPRITDITEQDNPKSWIMKRETIDSIYIIQWEEVYNDNWCYIKHGYYKKYNLENKLVESIKYHLGVMNGEYKHYYENGNLKEFGNYKNDLKHGNWSYFDSNGNQIAYGKFKNGTGKTWFMNKQQRSEEKYQDGRKHGSWKKWYKNGQLAHEINFYEWKKHGIELKFYPNGTIKLKHEYVDNFIKDKSLGWYENGTIKFERTYGKYWLDFEILYYENGFIKSSKTINFACEDDPWKEWYANGQLKNLYITQCCSKYYLSKNWDVNGVIRFHKVLRGNRQDSIVIIWYPNGQKKDEKVYNDAESMYVVKNWHENGHLESWGYELYKYKKGIWKYWDSEGNFVREENYNIDSLSK